MSSSNLIALILSLILIAPDRLSAQQQPASGAAQLPAEASNPVRRVAPGGLRMIILEGQGVVNSLITRSAISPVVQVLDSLDQPLQGATVTFEAPPMGPGGAFGSEPIATVKSDVNGQATAAFTPNKTSGAFTIKVTASYGDQSATVAIRQVNDSRITEPTVAPTPKAWYRSWKWWAVIGAGAGAGIAAATILTQRSGTPTITLSTGSVVIGGPR